MENFTIEFLETQYNSFRETSVKGRRVLIGDIESILKNLSNPFKVSLLGSSELNQNIYKIHLGTGNKRILLWSQMHGNESTGTKALLDLFNFILDKNNSIFTQKLLETCTLVFIPILNPDGSDNFTRVNANNIDLNRDAVDLLAKESRLLRSVLDEFNPHFCFNLHDQRSIFNVEGYKNPATISFLAPSINEERTLTRGRKETMSVIVAMNNALQKIIPNFVGRYTDEFYPTATGDNFQKLGHNTILIEAGHFYEDYDRELVRKYNFYALVFGLKFLAETNDYSNYLPYFDIPNNGKQNFDLIIRNFPSDDSNNIDIAFQYEYEVVEGVLASKLIEHQRGQLEQFNGYKEISF